MLSVIIYCQQLVCQYRLPFDKHNWVSLGVFLVLAAYESRPCLFTVCTICCLSAHSPSGYTSKQSITTAAGNTTLLPSVLTVACLDVDNAVAIKAHSRLSETHAVAINAYIRMSQLTTMLPSMLTVGQQCCLPSDSAAGGDTALVALLPSW